MRLAMRVLVGLAVPGLVFGFLLRVPPVEFDPFGFDVWVVEPSWVDVLPALLAIPPVLFVVAAVYIVVDWLTSGPRPGRRAS